MKRALSEQEQALRSQGRRRMIGAAVIMGAVVVFLPMILDHSRSPKLVAETPTEPMAAPVAQALPQEPVQAPAPAQEPAAQQAPATAPPPLAEQEKIGDHAAKAPSDKAPSAAGGFLVQVGVFADRSKAMTLNQKLNEHGILSYTEEARLDGQNRTRVRVGPFASRAEAQDTVARLQKLGEKPVVIAP
jgi:DedD protein